ncbi:MAG: 50S ribosomal protein L24 [Alphaproteobacteria bacterium]|nr:50S ribosomal protein L24 [Alphaproteobacteria bacterium]
MVKLRVKRGDTVMVISGKDRGTVGEILSVDPQKLRLVVKGVNIVKRHQKPSATSAGGIVTSERSIHVSNVMHVDPKTKAPTRVGYKFLEDGRKVRIAKKSGEQIDS